MSQLTNNIDVDRVLKGITLDSVKVLDLPMLSLSEKGSLPEVPAVYFALSCANEVLYIGRAINLRSRWRQHHRYDQLRRFHKVRLAWLELSEYELDTTERILIEAYEPPLNESRKDEAIVKPRWEPHCSACRFLGQIAQWDLLYCLAHGGMRLLLQSDHNEFIDSTHRLILLGNYSLTLRLDAPARMRVATQELEYEDFHELP